MINMFKKIKPRESSQIRHPKNNKYYIFFLDSRKLHPPENALCGPRWASKTPAVPGSYKRCTPWLELETCYADLKPFAITLLGSMWTALAHGLVDPKKWGKPVRQRIRTQTSKGNWVKIPEPGHGGWRQH